MRWVSIGTSVKINLLINILIDKRQIKDECNIWDTSVSDIQN